MKYRLNKVVKGKKYEYTVTDEKGSIISKRISTRDYVACTINGEFYFGRLDLIGKGDHGRLLKICSAEYTENDTSELNKKYEDRLKELNQIAYL